MSESRALRALEKENDNLQERIKELYAGVLKVVADSNQAQIEASKRIRELEAALVKFGNHKYDCGLSVIERCSIPEIIELGEQKFECPRICDCGLEQALKG